jgi:predicted GH43/DUF377 family glycosyl hydrolase
MSSTSLRRHDVTLLPDSARVIIRPFVPDDRHHVTTILGRALALTEPEVSRDLAIVLAEFQDRHLGIEPLLLAHFERVRPFVFTQRPLTRERTLLIGALFSGEYALESAAIFNPSIVPHPDQSDAPLGGLRFVMSLRATGEGHISSIEFRCGTVAADGGVTVDPVSRFVSAPEIIPDPSYQKDRFQIKMREMDCDDRHADAVLAPLGERFTRSELATSMRAVRHESQPSTHELRHTLGCVQWLADSNYELRFSDSLAISERIIFPVSANEANGIEDARFVRFVDDDGSETYYATYTAYNGHDILPQLIRTEDFLRFHILTLNGDAVRNKGMALFPRRIAGRYAMLSRQDNENLFIMFSDRPDLWTDPELILRPAAMWESVKVGNCGSPIETEAGWLVITHGVGPMRTYSLGAVLLDLEHPERVIGRLAEPLLAAVGLDREGYVPNVVYSCGSLVHAGKLILPFAVSDRATTIASLPLDELLAALRPCGDGSG